MERIVEIKTTVAYIIYSSIVFAILFQRSVFLANKDLIKFDIFPIIQPSLLFFFYNK